MADTKVANTKAADTKVARASSAWVVTLASSQGPAAAGTPSTTRTPTTGGTWKGAELNSDPEFGDRTVLYCGGEEFAEFMIGWQVQINAAVPVYLDIVGVDGELLYVSGDVTALVTAEETEFCIIHPVGVNPQNGATQTNPCQPESRYLWGGGYYLPPVAGFEMDHEGVFGIHGAQPGQNKSGQHYMWNRRYDIHMGRWTTPDPAAQYVNLFSFVGEKPTSQVDPSGLITWEDFPDEVDKAPDGSNLGAMTYYVWATKSGDPSVKCKKLRVHVVPFQDPWSRESCGPLPLRETKEINCWSCKASYPDYTITSSFDRASSWRVKGKQTAALLRHENLHLTISEEGAAAAQAAIRALIGTGTSCKSEAEARKLALEDLDKLAKAEDASQWAAMVAIQEAYDTETDHGTKADEQAEWERGHRGD